MICGSHQSCVEVILQLLIYGLSNGAVLALNAIAVTVVYGTVRTLNLAHGDVFALTTVLVVTLLSGLGARRDWPPLMLLGALLLALIAAMSFGALLSVAIERAAFKPFRARSRLAPLIATLGISFILYQGALIWRTLLPSWVPGDHRSVPGLPEVPLEDRIPELLPDLDLVQAAGLPLNVTFRFNDLFVVLVAAACALGVSWFLRRTATGRAIRACAQDPLLAQLCGVNLDAAIRRAFAFGGSLAGVAAFIFALYYTRPFGNHGAQSGLLTFTAAIVGGIGSPVGAVLSGLLLGASTALSDYFIAAHWTPVLLQSLLIGLLILRPAGIASGERAEELALSGDRDSLTLAASDQSARWSRRAMWIIVASMLVFPAFDAALGLHKQVLVTGLGIFILLALGLNLQLGFAGILDLGYTVSFAIGGYMTAILTNRWFGLGAILPQPVDFTVTLPLSMLAAGLFGALKGQLTLRLRSDYLALVTLALGLMARQVIINLSDFTGGVGGIAGLPPPYLLTFPLKHPTAQYYLVFGLAILLALASQQLIRSRIGRAWLASSEDETAAASCGVNTAHYRVLALAISSAAAGLAGALYAGTFAYVAPEMTSFHVSAMTLAMVILGGAGRVPGAMLGAIVIAGYDRLVIPGVGAFLAYVQPAYLRLSAAPDIRGMSYLNFGLALYLTVLLRARRKE